MRSVFVILLLVAAVFADSQLPAVKISLSGQALDKIAAHFLPFIFSKLSQIHIPDINQTIPSPLGDVHLQLTNMTIALQQPTLDIDMVTGTGVQWTVSQLNTVVDMGFGYSMSKLFSGSGVAHASTTNGTIALLLGITDQQGRPGLVVLSDKVDLGKFAITITSTGGTIPGWLEKILVEVLSGVLKSLIEKTATSEIGQLIGMLSDKYLSQLPTVVPLGKHLQLDVALAAAPAFSDDFISIPLRGRLEEPAHPDATPAFPVPVLPDHEGEWLEIIYSDYVFNSAIWALTDEDLLDLVVRDSQLPAFLPVRLNTKSWRHLVPALDKLYPDMEMTLRIESPPATEPRVRIDPVEGMDAVHLALLAFNVLTPQGEVPAFTLEANISSDVTIGIVGTAAAPRLAAQLHYDHATLQVTQTSVGPLADLFLIADTMDELLEHVVLPEYNKLFAQGLPLPAAIEGVEIVDPEVVMGDDFLVFQADIAFA